MGLRILDALDQRGVLRAVFFSNRLGRVVEGFLVHLDELHAGRLQFRLGVGNHLVPQPALFELRFAGELGDKALIFFRELVPARFREHKDLGDDQVTGKAVELGDLVMILREQRRRVVLRAVDDARLQRVVELVEPHRDAVSAHRVHGLDENRVAHHADLLTFEIGWARDWLLRIDVTRAGIHPAQTDELRVGIGAELAEQLLADRTVDHFPHMRFVAEHERQIEDVQLVDDRAHRTDRDARDLERAHLRLLDHLFLAAELHGGKHLDRQPAVGRRFHLLAHSDDRFDGRITKCVNVGGLEHHLLLSGAGQRRHQQTGGDERCGGNENATTDSHETPPR
jgi:hypothetical protein